MKNPFTHPRKDWNNRDLLLTEDAREAVAAAYPTLFPLLDWPELRSAFLQWENVALVKKKTNRHMVLGSVSATTFGLCVLAAAPLLGFYGIGSIATFIGTIILIAGASLGFYLSFLSSFRESWLRARFWAERTRQFYFQFIASNIDTICEASVDTEKQSQWLKKREAALNRFLLIQKEEGQTAYNEVIDDTQEVNFLVVDDRVLSNPHWSKESDDFTSAVSNVASYLHLQRLDYQITYARSQNLPKSLYSKQRAGTWLRLTGNLLTFFFIIAIAGNALHFLSLSIDQAYSISFAAMVQGILAASIAAIRVLEEALAWSVEASRYIRYEKALAEADRVLSPASISILQSGLLDIERAAYQELRAFILAHKDTRFIAI